MNVLNRLGQLAKSLWRGHQPEPSASDIQRVVRGDRRQSSHRVTEDSDGRDGHARRDRRSRRRAKKSTSGVDKLRRVVKSLKEDTRGR